MTKQQAQIELNALCAAIDLSQHTHEQWLDKMNLNPVDGFHSVDPVFLARLNLLREFVAK